MSLLVKAYASSIDYVMKNGKRIVEKGEKAVYEYVNKDGRRFLLSTKNDKPFKMVNKSNLKNGTRYTVIEDFEKNMQVGIYSDEFQMVKHVKQQDPTWDIVNQEKLFSFFKATENMGLSVRIEDLKNKLGYQCYHNPWGKYFKVEKLELPHWSGKEMEKSIDTSANGFENVKNFIRKYSEPIKVKPAETSSENVVNSAPTMLD